MSDFIPSGLYHRRALCFHLQCIPQHAGFLYQYRGLFKRVWKAMKKCTAAFSDGCETCTRSCRKLFARLDEMNISRGLAEGGSRTLGAHLSKAAADVTMSDAPPSRTPRTLYCIVGAVLKESLHTRKHTCSSVCPRKSFNAMSNTLAITETTTPQAQAWRVNMCFQALR